MYQFFIVVNVQLAQSIFSRITILKHKMKKMNDKEADYEAKKLLIIVIVSFCENKIHLQH